MKTLLKILGGIGIVLILNFLINLIFVSKNRGEKYVERAREIEGRITGEIQPKEAGVLGTVWGALPDGEGTFNAGRDAAIGVMTEASYSPEMITAMTNNATIIKAYPAIVRGALGTQFPMASLRLNSSLYFAAAKQTFNPNVLKSLGTGFAWGMAGAVVDGASDQYENSIYDDTLKYFKRISNLNAQSKGINVTANKG